VVYCTVQVTLGENGGYDEEEDEEPWYEIVVSSNGAQRGWTIQRSYSSLYRMDQQLHSCIFDRSFSRLPEMTENLVAEIGAVVCKLISYYFHRLYWCRVLPFTITICCMPVDNVVIVEEFCEFCYIYLKNILNLRNTECCSACISVTIRSMHIYSDSHQDIVFGRLCILIVIYVTL